MPNDLVLVRAFYKWFTYFNYCKKLMWAHNDTIAHVQEVIQLAFIQMIMKFPKLLTCHIAGNQQQKPLATQKKAIAALCLFHCQQRQAYTDVKMCYCENSILVWENHMIHNAVM
jgi:hypothetical protein